ncbi:MAG: family 16 glycosylhydrolase [Bacteroidetes bacterium]|nr:family 16 glycosylhydrolase [Bacteroidota bacterium]
MANIAFGSKYFIFSKFSSIPKTSKIEKDRADLRKEYDDYNAFNESQALQDFRELEQYLESKEHIHLMNKLKDQKKAEEERIKLYEAQKKSKKFKNHFKFKASARLSEHLNFAQSKEWKRYNELKDQVTSNEFLKQKTTRSEQQKRFEAQTKELEVLAKAGAVKKFKKDPGNEELAGNTDVKKYNDLKNKIESEDFKAEKAAIDQQLQESINLEKEYRQLARSSAVKKFIKFEQSPKYKAYLAFEKSKILADYLVLADYLRSSEHADLLKTIESQMNQENDKKKKYEEFKNSKEYKWFTSLTGTTKFDELKKWKVVFEDDFNGELDREKWLTRYYWGDQMIKDAYALEHDKAFPTDGKNIETGKTIKIITRREKVDGKVWKMPFGFIPQDFDFTTGLINTAKSHRQLYGRIEAKIKINFAKPVNYNFWMASDKMLPHIDILKLSHKKSKVEVAHHFGEATPEKAPERARAEFKGLDVAQDFFIYTLDWTKEKLTWKINDVVVNEQTRGVPQEPLYITFSCGITGKPTDSGLPASMEVDWVKCYQETK